jgi:geranylgeranyl reductase family protein
MPETLIHDITIIGAGPAGLCAAIRLGQKGIPCLLIDGSKPSRPKICGDGLSGKVISTLNRIDPGYALELTTQPYVTPSYAVRFFSPRLRMVEIGFQSPDPSVPPGVVCQRQDFDRFMLTKALSFHTVKHMPGTMVSKAESSDEGYILSDGEGKYSVRTKLVLFATGSDRSLIKSILPDFPGIQAEGLGVRAYFDRVTGSDEKHSIEIHFLKELLPWYLWIFPFKDGSANVGLALPMKKAVKNQKSLKQLLFDLIEKYPHLKERFEDAQIKGNVEAHRLPYFTGRLPVSGDHFLLLGDAAHLIDPFTGEGISHAMISGLAAAQVAADCLEKSDFSRGATGDYDRVIYGKLGQDLEQGLRLQQLANNQRLLNLVIGKASKNIKVRQLLEEMLYNMNTKGKLSQPMFYLKLMLGI